LDEETYFVLTLLVSHPVKHTRHDCAVCFHTSRITETLRCIDTDCSERKWEA